MKKSILVVLSLAAAALDVHAQLELSAETQLTASDGSATPLWLNANKYGLSSLDDVNGYLRAGVFRHQDEDSTRRWRLGFGADVAVASGFTSTMVVQQAYGELGWLKGLLTVGSKQQPMELKNQELSTGSQALGINARPVPAIRLSLPDYWDVPYTKGWLGLKGHISYGMFTDDKWQKDFTNQQTRYTEHTLLHTKAGYLRIGKVEKPVSVELGLEMACQYGGTSYAPLHSPRLEKVENTGGLKGALKALIPGGGDVSDDEYANADGNHLGSMMARVNFDYPTWGVSAYADHYFEDQSMMFMVDYDGFGTGEKWDEWEDNRWLVYDLKDILLGVELRLKDFRWVNTVVAEYLYTKYQSGPNYHDHTRHLSDHIGGRDEYYNHHLYTGWQHWGQVMGNPLYRSPLYNSDGNIRVADNRFWAWHLAVNGDPLPGLHYRMMCTWQRGFGTYKYPLLAPQRNLSLLAEATYQFGDASSLSGWNVSCGVGLDRGSLLGDNTGVQLTVGRKIFTKKGK
ncbi:MAG: capsule assembly Wzi family protein [Prevotella sp.]|nr:capsule assembly Wzi family protein [Prevotella sp.]